MKNKRYFYYSILGLILLGGIAGFFVWSPQDVPMWEQDPVLATLPEQVLHDVPFTSQAPSVQWSVPLYQDACEEASILMSMAWVDGKTEDIARSDAEQALEALFAFQQERYGNAFDTSAVDTLQLLRDYFDYHKGELVSDPTEVQIMEALAEGSVVIVPADGQWLDNKHFSGNGPERHMLVIVGYDRDTQEFITNDPGTRRGKEFRYTVDNLMTALRDYPTGHKVPITEERRAMIIIRR